jgi:hypothetical protein
MGHRVYLLTARLTALVLVATLLSPHFGWQMLASHDELEHVFAHSTQGGDAHHPHDHDSDAHSFLGHLLTHMPLIYTDAVTLASIQRSPVETGVLRVMLHTRAADPPFIPPRLLFQS